VEEMVATYIECGGYEEKGIQTQENKRQGFLPEEKVKNTQCKLCKEAWD